MKAHDFVLMNVILLITVRDAISNGNLSNSKSSSPNYVKFEKVPVSRYLRIWQLGMTRYLISDLTNLKISRKGPFLRFLSKKIDFDKLHIQDISKP